MAAPDRSACNANLRVWCRSAATSMAASNGCSRARHVRSRGCVTLPNNMAWRCKSSRHSARSNTSSASLNASWRADRRSTKSCASLPRRVTASTTAAAVWISPRRDSHHSKKNSSDHPRLRGCKETPHATASPSPTHAKTGMASRTSLGIGVGMRVCRGADSDLLTDCPRGASGKGPKREFEEADRTTALRLKPNSLVLVRNMPLPC